jgi:exopolyphosphatase/guanosine-5'-triphosphate,3'-diphosphate pyrophosphatase
MDAAQSETITTVAAVDLGSNSFHMIVAQPVGGQLRIIDRMRETVRLANGLDGRNQLSADARERALACLQRFGQRLRAMPPGSVRVVGTNTLRKARNVREFLEAASSALGHPVEVIAGREEARLIYLGVSHSLPDSGHNHLVIDIGGGSTEVIIGKRFDALHRESLFMGCVSFSEAYFPKGAVSEAAMTQAVLAARLELEPVEGEYRRIGWDDTVGASGTVRAVAQVAKEMGWGGDGITLEALRQLRAALVRAGNVGKLELKGLKDDRRPVLAGGVAVLIALFESLGIDRMQVSDWALREGLLFDLVGRIRHEDVRERTIVALTGQYYADMAQAQRVRRTALRLLNQVIRDWSLGSEEDGNLLAWAAELHEIGLAVAHASHHKHAAYLIANSDLPGFSREEQRLLAAVVRAHRRKLPLAELKELPAAESVRALRLAVLLRLAVALHRSRSDAPLPEVALSANDKGARLAFPAGWLDAHPLTRADLEVEAEFLKAAKVRLAFG